MKTRDESKIEVQFLSISELKTYLNNPKEHPEKQIQQLKNSIQKFDFINPIIVDENNEIIAGHGRLEAAKQLGLKVVPVIRVEHLSKAEIRAYRIADNQLTLNSSHDPNLLKIELSEITAMDADLDLEITGLEMAQIDLIMDDSFGPEHDPADDIPEPDDEPSITRLGDIYQMGGHLLICGNALEATAYDVLLNEERAHAVFADAPYNVKINGHVGGNGKIQHREFANASGEMNRTEFTAFLTTAFKLLADYSVDGSVHFQCMDWRHQSEILQASDEAYNKLLNLCIWNKNNGGMGSLYRSKHELVYVFKSGTKPHINNVALGAHGRYRTNVWDYVGVNSFGKNQSDLEMHPTVKPIAMVADAIKDVTKRGQLVLDPFAGSGTTLIACEKTGRVARCIELDPKYCDVIIRRWQKLTGNNAIHLESGNTFNAMNGGCHE